LLFSPGSLASRQGRVTLRVAGQDVTFRLRIVFTIPPNMPRPVITAADVKAAARAGELLVPAEAILTDQAREVAAELGVRVRVDGLPASSEAEVLPASRTKSMGTVALGADHAGFELKEYLKHALQDMGYAVLDLGTTFPASVDYPDFARAVAELVASGKAWRGIVIDGAGIGSAIAANKVPGIRAALCYDRATAHQSREHNDANVLALGARMLRPEEAREIAAVWLETAFAGGRHAARLEKIKALEASSIRAGSVAREVPAIDSLERERLIEAIAREVLCQLGEQPPGEGRGLEREDAVCPGCDGRCAEACPEKARTVLAAGAARLSAGHGVSRVPADIAALIDHTLLKPEATEAQIRQLCDEARRFGFATVCVNPAWVPLAVALLRGSVVKVCTVAGFPLGATLTGVKRFEAEQAVRLGAREIDMVLHVGALKSGQHERVEQDIRGVVETCHRGGAICKVILECALLTDQEKVTACQLAKSAGADFVKTSTGFASGGATAHDVELMRLAVGPETGVKAAGGIRSYADLQRMLRAGATRIGASASVKIMQEAAGSASGAGV
jgi:deoxyribose-phosphate aldolase